MGIHNIRVERKAPLEDLSPDEVCVLPAYFIEAATEAEALEALYWHTPVENNPHFAITVHQGRG